MKKSEIKEIRKQVMEYVTKVEKETALNSFDKVDGKAEISQDEAINMGKMLLLLEMVKGLEKIFDEYMKKTINGNPL